VWGILKSRPVGEIEIEVRNVPKPRNSQDEISLCTPLRLSFARTRLAVLKLIWPVSHHAVIAAFERRRNTLASGCADSRRELYSRSTTGGGVYQVRALRHTRAPLDELVDSPLYTAVEFEVKLEADY
jgi:hypothetical protein